MIQNSWEWNSTTESIVTSEDETNATESQRIEGLAENEFKEGATYVYPANTGEEGRENLLSIERVDDGYYKPHYRVTEISYRGDFTTSTHSLYAGQWLIDDEQQKIDWDDIANHSKQWEGAYETWEDILSDNEMALEPREGLS